MTYRETGKKALSTVLNIRKNIDVFEKYIYEHSKDRTEYLVYIYQTIGDIIKSNGKKLSNILANIKENKLGRKHPCFDTIKQRLKEHDAFVISPFEVEEGVNTCSKCNSKKTYSYQKQVRGCDEPMTSFIICIKCKHSWSYSG